ncbi:hypothetical protein [Aquipseudomonas campi]
MEFLSSPSAFWAWLVGIGAAEVARVFLYVLAYGALRNWRAIRQKITVGFQLWRQRSPVNARDEKPTKNYLSATQRIAQRENYGRLRRAFRLYKLHDNRWVRRYRFDETWINREVSRGHSCFLIMLIWFGFWITAIGLKEVFLLKEGPLSSAPSAVFMAAMPMYLFELAWLRYSGRAGQLISYRNKVKIWRWWH